MRQEPQGTSDFRLRSQGPCRHVYYGAKDEKAGSVESVTKLFDLPYNHRPTAQGGILEEECGALLTEFFETLREQRREH